MHFFVGLLLAAVAQPAAVPGYSIGVQVHLGGPDLEQAKAAGFEHGEVVLRDLATLSDSDFAATEVRVQKAGLPVRAAIGFLPADMMVVGPKIAKEAQQNYLTRAFTRAERLGITTVVFGSAGSRRYPVGFSAVEAGRQLEDFSRRAAALAAQHHVVIALEALGPEDTNTINTVPAAVALVRAVNQPAFQLCIDYFHLRQSKEEVAVVRGAKGVLRHVRIANPAGRAYPLAATESDYASFFEALADVGYRGPIGVETRTGTISGEGPRAVAFLREQAATLAQAVRR